MKLSLIALTLFSFILFDCNGQYISRNTDVQTSKIDNNSREFEKAMLAAVNEWRQKGCRCGSKRMRPTTAVGWNDKLTKAAQKHAADLERRQTLDHTGADGSSISDRAEAAGYNWQAIAENIAWNYPNIQTVVDGWISSPGHCKNIMNPDYKEIGVYRQGDYWVMMLGAEL